MSLSLYQQITALKNEQNDVLRGRLFEQIIREIMPWDHRPPVVMSPESEQLDGVFVYQGSIFLIECKAVKAAVTPGSKEWEDFELKLRKRERQNIIGIFCSLFPVSQATIDQAELLNKFGIKTIIIAGDIWDKLDETNLYFQSFLDFLVLNCKIKFQPTVTSLKDAGKWVYDVRAIEEQFTSLTKKFSGPFLRRFKHKFHDKVFISRTIDKRIRQLADAVKPISLKVNPQKDTAKQIVVIRDYSGSGKTTLSTNLASLSDFAYCLASTANLTTIDMILEPFFDQLNYPNNALNELLAANKPLIYIVDSLDETPVQQQVQKKREIKALLKYVEEFNTIAVKQRLGIFPLLVIFTVREEYWRDWEAAFEGRQEVVELKKMISAFTEVEFETALQKYSGAYDYSITNRLNAASAGILSIPVNLEIFSEANHFEGDLTVSDIWEGKILSGFFSKKEELIDKHYIDRFNAASFYRILAMTAFEILKSKTTLISKSTFIDVVVSISAELELSVDRILLQLMSEQIITNDTEDTKNYRFKYIRFIEYLAALYIIQEVERSTDFKVIDSLIKTVYDSNIASIFNVFNNLKHIAKTQFAELEKDLVNYYAHSATYLSRYLPELRGRISRGEGVSEEDIKAILTITYTPSAETSWDTFFIISAKHRNVTREVIFSTFSIAWTSNAKNNKRWQLVGNIAKRGLFVSEQVLLSLMSDGTPREWEEYLGQVLELSKQDTFIELWQQIGGEKALAQLSHHSPEDWQVTNRLLDLIVRNERYVLGDIMADASPEDYLLFVPQKKKKTFIISDSDRHVLDELVEQIRAALDGRVVNTLPMPHRLNDVSKDAESYLAQEVEEIINATYGSLQKPFINYLVNQFSNNYNLINTLLETTVLHYPLHEVDKERKTVFVEIIESDSRSRTGYLEDLFKRGYHKCQFDEDYIIKAIENRDDYDFEEFEYVMIGYCFLKLKSQNNRANINLISRQLMTLFTFRYQKIVSFKFANMVSVMNNALQHYGDFTDIFWRAASAYQIHDELMTAPSIKKKVLQFKARPVVQNHQYDAMLEEIFPELFH
ncbi:NACHT domain-containing protein [Mucilaginibacter sp.]|uniref:NACHT domain-containing protein n=1 Tax=Mucilaginibacter sp. TaxID=1882438 RepID=UPI003D0D89DA